MKRPLTNNQEVLHVLITQGHVSIFDFPYLSGFRTRVSNLKLKFGIDLETIKNRRCNKFGNAYTYHIHRLVNKEKAVEVYKKMTINN